MTDLATHQSYKLLGFTNAKTEKGEKKGWRTAIMYLAPHKVSGRANMCSHASKGCAKACLFTAGRGQMNVVERARMRKTDYFLDYRAEMVAQLSKEIAAHKRHCDKKGIGCCVRLNGTSDIPWENVRLNGKNLMQMHPDVQFYDYTKNHNRDVSQLDNYHITFSRAEDNEQHIPKVLAKGWNVAVVFNSADLPDTYMGIEVVDGDTDDLRFLDGSGVIVGLKAKGQAKKDKSGFVVEVAQ